MDTKEERIKVFWKKSSENFEVAKSSYERGQYNACASRYYYALYLGFWAFFEKNNIVIKKTQTSKGSWDKKALRDQAESVFSEYEPNTGTILNSAWELRVRADYKDLLVGEDRLVRLSKRIERLINILDKQING